VAGSFALLILPLLVGALGDSLGIGPKEMGFLASADLVGMGLSSGLGVFWVRRVPWRVSAALALILFIGANLLTTQVTSYSALIVLRFLAGLGGGAAMAVGLACQSDSKHANRLFALFIFAQSFCIFLGFTILGQIRIDHGLNGVLMGIVVFCIPALLLTLALPRKGIDRAAAVTAAGGEISMKRPILCLIAAFLFFTSIGGVWAFAEGIGVAEGVAKADISKSLGFAAFAAMTGSLLAAWLTEKLGLMRILIIAAVLAVSALILLSQFEGSKGYLMAICAFQLGAAMGIPLMLACINAFDSTGKLVVLMLGTIKLGYATGPAVMGQVISGNDFSLVFIISGVLSLVGLLGNSLLMHSTQKKMALSEAISHE
jgi:predicted MFS family arabinose efflux permease